MLKFSGSIAAALCLLAPSVSVVAQTAAPDTNTAPTASAPTATPSDNTAPATDSTAPAAPAAAPAMNPDGSAQAPATSTSHTIQVQPNLPAPSNVPWKPTAAQVSQLAQAVTLASGYSIRPPVGYQLTKKPSPDGFGDIFYWSGPQRTPLKPSIAVLMITAKSNTAKGVTADQILVNLLASSRYQRLNWNNGLFEHGTVNGIPFERTRWSAADIDDSGKPGQPIHGIDYVAALKPGTWAAIMIEDPEAETTTTLPELEASAQTFSPSNGVAPADAPAAASH